jgi:hypothetical protein
LDRDAISDWFSRSFGLGLAVCKGNCQVHRRSAVSTNGDRGRLLAL